MTSIMCYLILQYIHFFPVYVGQIIESFDIICSRVYVYADNVVGAFITTSNAPSDKCYLMCWLDSRNQMEC